MNKNSHQPALLHAVLALAAISALTAMTMLGSLSYSTASLGGERSQHIAVETLVPLRLSIAVADGKQPGIVDITHDAQSGAHVIVPAQWTVREVRGAAMTNVVSEPPALDARRWSVPSGATLSFSVNHLGPLTALSVTGVPLQIDWKRVDVVSGRVREDTVLVKDKAVEF